MKIYSFLSKQFSFPENLLTQGTAELPTLYKNAKPHSPIFTPKHNGTH